MGSWGVKALESDNGLDLIFLLKSDYLPKHKKLTLGGLIGFLKEEGFLGETVNEIDFLYRDAIARYLYLGDREKALQTAERLATSRLWAVAGPTQVRPMSFFEDPNLREFLLEPESLRRIREAAFIDDGSLIRK